MLTVSVALATYNGEKYIGDQLQSILNQSYQPTEIVICDDSSVDATVKVIDQFIDLVPDLVRFERNQINLGFAHNFEKAISLCKGDVVVLCDQDDVWFPHKIESIVQKFEAQPDCGLIFTEAVVANEDLVSLGYTLYARHQTPDLWLGFSLNNLVRKTVIKGCTLAFRRYLSPYCLPISSQDWGHDHWIVFVAGVLSQICMIDEPLMYYRRHAGSAGNDPVLDNRLKRTVAQVWRNLTLDAYERDRRRWSDMFQHLKSLDQNSSMPNYESLALGIEKVRQRLNFAEARLRSRYKKRTLRLPTLIKLLWSGQYHKYTRGYRTMIKDMIA